MGEKRAVRLTGSYSIRAYFQGATTPLSFAKIIIREDFPPDTYVDEAGVYVLIRADDWMAGWLDREPWTRVDLEQTIRIISVLFYGFDWAAGTTWTRSRPRSPRWCWNSRLKSGRRGARAPRPPTPPDVRVSYPAVLLSAVALDTSAPGLDSTPTPTTLAAPLWAQIGFRPLRLPRGAPRPLPEQRELVRPAFPRLHAHRVIRSAPRTQEVQPFPARPGPVLRRLLTPPCPSNAIAADAVVRIIHRPRGLPG